MPRISIITLLYASLVVYLSVHFSAFFAFLSAPIIGILIFELIEERIIMRSVPFAFMGKLKRIKTEYGRFYIRYKKTNYGSNEVILYQDKVLQLKELDTHYYTNVDEMKKWIKNRYDAIYEQRKMLDRMNKEAKMKYSKETSDIKKWSGYIDLSDERDSKINQIVK